MRKALTFLKRIRDKMVALINEEENIDNLESKEFGNKNQWIRIRSIKNIRITRNEFFYFYY